MNEIEKWCTNKNYIIAIAASQIVACAEPCYEFLTELKAGKKIHKNEITTDLKEWILLYRNHKKVSKYLRSFCASISPFADKVISFLQMFEQLLKEIRCKGEKQFNDEIKEEVAKLNEEEKNEIIDSVIDFYQMNMDDINSDITNNFSVENKKKIEAELNRPELIFYIRVEVPCQLLYGSHPVILLRKARLGDIDSLKKLLRLDPSIIQDKKIAKIFHQSRLNKKSKFDSMVSAMDQPPIKSLTAKSIKYSFAGLISAISEIVGSKLTEPEIRELFNAYQVDAGKDDIDCDLPDSPEAFSKAIQRGKKFWLNAIHYPDKN
jgi:hypothetical protein